MARGVLFGDPRGILECSLLEDLTCFPLLALSGAADPIKSRYGGKTLGDERGRPIPAGWVN
ncbi:MAG: hypothetical protein WAW81_00790, partial [Minisyncoccia bacterium]